MDGGLESHDHADRPRAHLRIGLVAGGAHAMDLASVSRHRSGWASTWTSRQESGRPASVAAASSASNSPGPKSELTSITPRPARLMPCGDAQELGLARRERGREASVAGLVLGGARGGEAHGAGAQCFLGEARHLLDLAFARDLVMLGAAIAHDVEAQCAMRQLRRHVDGTGHRAQGIEIVGKGSPS